VVVDYLQLLERRRRDPELGEQLSALAAFTQQRGLITVCLSQISRAFERSPTTVPTRADVHQPNPLNLDVFTKGCFLHDGHMRIDHWG
jgi:replicative DNA helicase